MTQNSNLAGRASRKRTLTMEHLEGRALLAGNVLVKISGGDVVITGDNSSNSVEISQPSLDRYKVTGRTHNGAPTKINGVANGSVYYNLSSFSDDVRITMNGGSDKVFIHGNDSDIGDLDAYDNFEISMGSGDDTLTLQYLDAQDGDVIVDLGTGADNLFASHINASDDFIVRNSTTSRTRAINKVNLDDIFAGDELNIDLSYSLDRVNITNSDVDYLFVKLRSGDDKLNIKTSERDIGSSLDGGSGNDDLNFYRNRTTFSYANFKSPTNKNITYT